MSTEPDLSEDIVMFHRRAIRTTEELERTRCANAVVDILPTGLALNTCLEAILRPRPRTRSEPVPKPMCDSPKTVLGKRLCALRAKIVASGTPLADWNELMDFQTAEAKTEAVEAERKRAAEIFRRYVRASGGAWGPGASNPPKASDYLAEILSVTPEPPAPEPMTVEDVMERLRRGMSGTLLYWDDVEKWLSALVQDQARKDAAICNSVAEQTGELGDSKDFGDPQCEACHDAIRKAAGL